MNRRRVPLQDASSSAVQDYSLLGKPASQQWHPHQVLKLLLLIAGLAPFARAAEWQPGKAPLMTRWGRQVTVDRVHPEYPRPQLVRADWLNLNGLWQFATVDANDANDEAEPPPIGRELGEQILVPFPIESALSGITRQTERAWYRRTFELPAEWAKSQRNRRIWLRFGAVDWHARVWINGKPVGEHRGGYDPFGFDITDALKPDGPQELVVGVFDPSDAGTQAHGKQHKKAEGIWYTPTTGIWQTVWLEPVPVAGIERLQITPDADKGQVTIRVHQYASASNTPAKLVAIIREGDREVVRGEGQAVRPLTIELPNATLWSPTRPHLYDLTLSLWDGAKPFDDVTSYFGLRKIELKQFDGVTRLAFNGEPLFQVGPLDQGFWPDGLYTAPSDEAQKFDIEATRRLGFNMSRKHVKVEPDRWYYWCDKLGLLVWQDMPHGDKVKEAADQFEGELARMIEHLGNHPSIVMWVVFNEGWGQYDTPRLVEQVRKLDPTRIVSNASGWFDQKCGDVIDMHAYPGPGAPQPEPTRAAVLGEFGGLGLAIENHVWTGKAWSYRGTAGREELTLGYQNLLRRTWQLRDKPGLSAAVYTQLTDVEQEINGLLTYDREEVKVDPNRVAAANRGKFPRERIIVPTAREESIEWRYTDKKPADDWTKPEFDASGWKSGIGGFGAEGTPGAVVRTPWKSGDIWLRREVTLPAQLPDKLVFVVHHDEECEIYVNGVLAAKTTGYTTDYEWVALSDEGRKALRAGKNVWAVHCHNRLGGQYIDVGLAELQ
ncbi:MAG: glycoside hydrolase family 2 [Pirellulales bacterium]|nr:glycoside hydrolase family 2 [Pirellulales bacterium]